MKVSVAESSGFCRGVRHAVETAQKLAGPGVYILGELVHNPLVTEDLSRRGIVTVETVEEVPCGSTLILRSHGVGRSVYEQCAERGLHVVDCTCPFVKRTQKIVQRAAEQGKSVLIVGERLHPEVIGLIGWSGEDTFVACSEEECATLSAGKELAVVAQTTCPEEIFEKIVKFVSKGREKTVEIFKTICYTTKERQEEAEQLAKNSDAMLVIGGANSSNTNRLKEICSRYCANVFRLTDASEFRSDLLKNFKNVGTKSLPRWRTDRLS